MYTQFSGLKAFYAVKEQLPALTFLIEASPEIQLSWKIKLKADAAINLKNDEIKYRFDAIH